MPLSELISITKWGPVNYRYNTAPWYVVQQWQKEENALDFINMNTTDTPQFIFSMLTVDLNKTTYSKWVLLPLDLLAG